MTYRAINNEVYEKTKDFIIAALDLLMRKDKQIPYITVPKHKIEQEEPILSIDITQEPHPCYDLFISSQDKEIERLPEYKACIQAMRSDPTIVKHISGVNLRSRIIGRYFIYLLTKQLSHHPGRFEFDLEIFDHAFNDWEQFYYDDSEEIQEFSPLHTFTSDDDEISLGDSLRIRKITKNELEQLLDDGTVQMREMAPKPVYAIEYAYKRTKVTRIPPNGRISPIKIEEKERINKVLAALRLFKPGGVGVNRIRIKRQSAIWDSKSSRFGLSSRLFWGTSYYSLTKNEVKQFQSFWELFNKKIEQLPSLSITIRRFNDAYERDRPEDKLIDYMIAFETLLIKRGDRGELTHKIAVRSARLLTQNYEEREKIMKEMKKFYKARSKVVHGEKVTLSNEFISAVEDHLRNAIKLFLKYLQTNSHDSIISHLNLD